VMHDGQEHTKSFYHDQSIVTSYTSLLTGQPSNLFADCLTNCTVLVGNYDKIRKLNDKYLSLQIVARKVAEREFIKKDTREYQFLSMDAKERYKEFLKEHGEIQELIAHKYIASYLGIRSETLSRIKSQC
jgi:CRP-like cAMP-binding protein